MATVTKNVLRDLSADRVGDAFTSLKRQYIVSDLQSKDENVLQEALNDPDVPQPGTSPSGYPNLVLVKTSAKVHESDPSKVIIDLEYEARKNAKFNQEEFQFRVTGGSALQQGTQYRDRYGNFILLEHTFTEDWESRVTGEYMFIYSGFDVLEANTTLRFEGIIRTAYPHYISSTWCSALNSTNWAGGAPYTWMCTDVQFTLHDTAGDGVESTIELLLPAWQFTFEFLFKPDTHIPLAYMTDPSNHMIPPGLVANEGYKLIDWYQTRDFNELIPT